MKVKMLYGSMFLFVGFIALNQLWFVFDKHKCFKNDFHSVLWENHVADSSIKLCYFLTTVCMVCAISGSRLKVLKRGAGIFFNCVLGCFVVCSVCASIWMFHMHSNKEIVGYSEWIKHHQEVGKSNQNIISE